MKVQKLSYSIKEAVEATSYSRTHIYKMFDEGRLKRYKRDGRTFIKAKYLEKLIDEDEQNGRQG